MHINKKQVLHPLISTSAQSSPNEFFSLDWNWALHQALSAVTGLVKFIPGIGILATPYSELLKYVYGDVIDDLFPKKDANGDPTTDVTMLFQAFMAMAEEMMDTKITQLVKTNAATSLRTVHDQIDNFQRSLDNLENNVDPGHTERLKENIRTNFETLNSNFTSAVNDCSVEGYESDLLSSYAQVANLHLIYLREVVVKGADWGFESETINGFYDAPNTGNGLVQLIRKYSNNCVQFYQKGLDRLKEQDSVNLCDPLNTSSLFNQYVFNQSGDWGLPTCQNAFVGEYSYGCGPQDLKSCKSNLAFERVHSEYMQAVATWNRYNEYAQTMQILALDITAIWPYLDPKLYTIGAKKELTREIYTDIIGSPEDIIGNSNEQIDEVSKKLLPSPRLFTWLQQIDFNTEHYEYPYYTTNPGNGTSTTFKYINGDIIVGIYQHYKHTLGDDNITNPQGSEGSNTISIDVSNKNNKYIALGSWFEPRCVTLYDDPEDIFDFNTTLIGSISDDTPVFQIADYTDQDFHRVLMSMYSGVPFNNQNEEIAPFQLLKQLDSYSSQVVGGEYVFGLDEHRISYLQYSPSNALNIFVSTGKQLGSLAVGWTSSTVDPSNEVKGDAITSLPAVKASSITARGAGTVIKGPGHTGGDLVKLPPRTRLDMNLTYIQSEIKYKLRIRYANSTEGKVTPVVAWNGGNNWHAYPSIILPSTAADDNLKYEQFKLSSEQEVTLDQEDIVLQFYNDGNTDLIIDKIEFVPPSETLSDINYTISSNNAIYPIPASDPNHEDMNDFPTIWKAKPGESGVGATITASDLNTRATLFGKGSSVWEALGYLDSGYTTTFSLDNSITHFNEPFTEMKIACTWFYEELTSGKIIGEIETINI